MKRNWVAYGIVMVLLCVALSMVALPSVAQDGADAENPCLNGTWNCADPDHPAREAWNWACGWYFAYAAIGEYNLDQIPAWCKPPTDTDHDGIPDDRDLCPYEGGDVDETGCPVAPDGGDTVTDTDGDGVLDDTDLCPTMPQGATGDGGCPYPAPQCYYNGANTSLDYPGGGGSSPVATGIIGPFDLHGSTDCSGPVNQGVYLSLNEAGGGVQASRCHLAGLNAWLSGPGFWGLPDYVGLCGTHPLNP